MSDRGTEREKGQVQTASEAEDQRRSDDDEGFLQRWSRRKHQAARGKLEAEDLAPGDGDGDDSVDTTTVDVVADPAVQPDAAATVEPEPPGDDDMPPLESIDEGGSVKDFFSPNVSEGLRRSALRRLWRQPEFLAEDLLDDYARDYSKREPLGNIVTAEMRYRAEQLRQRMERKLKEGLAETDEDVAPDRLHTERVAATENPAAPEDAIEDSNVESDAQVLADAARRPADPPDAEGQPGSDRRPV